MRSKNVIAYIRVSTPKQGESGYGEETQRACIEMFARQHGLTIVKTLVEHASARGPNSIHKRVHIREALNEAETSDVSILVAKLDRLSRHVATVEGLMRNKRLRIIFADLGIRPSHATVMSTAAAAQRETELLGSRTSDRLAAVKANGRPLGNRTNLDEAQRKGCAANVRNAAQRREHTRAAIEVARRAGAKTSQQVADHLNLVRHPNAHGVLWKASNVRQAETKIRRADRSALHGSTPIARALARATTDLPSRVINSCSTSVEDDQGN